MANKNTTNNTTNNSIEESFVKIEQLLEQLESGKVSLEEAFKLYKDGISLVNDCNGQIDRIEKQIIELQDGE